MSESLPPLPVATLRRVLVVAADAGLRRTLSAWVEAAGFEAGSCASTAEVIERYDGESVVITDQLGEDGDGTGLVSWLQHARLQGSPWIGYWADAERARGFVAEDHGVNCVIDPGMEADGLRQLLGTAVGWLRQEALRNQQRGGRPRRSVALTGLSRGMPPQLPGARRPSIFAPAPTPEGRDGAAAVEQRSAPVKEGPAPVEEGQEVRPVEATVAGAIGPPPRSFHALVEQGLGKNGGSGSLPPPPVGEIDGPAQLRQAAATRQLLERRLWLDHAPTPQVLLDAELRVLAATRSWGALFRLSAEEVEGRLLTELLPEKADAWRRAAVEALAGREAEPTQELIRHGDGSCDWVRWQMRAWRDAEERPVGLLLTCELTTVQVERERELRTPFELGLSLLAETQLAMIALDLQGRIMRLNAGAEDLIGTAVEAGAELAKVLPLADPAGWLAGFVAAGEELGRSGQFAFARRVELSLTSGMMLPGLQMPWADEESFVRGVLLLLWPREVAAARDEGRGKVAARAEVYPSADLLPTLLSWPAAVFSAEGSERKANRAWRSLPTGLESHWPQADQPGAAEVASGEEGRHPGVLMVPLGGDGLDSWLAIAPPADAGRAAEQLRGRVEALQAELGRLGEERLRRETELNEVQRELGDARKELVRQKDGHERALETRDAELKLLRNQTSELRIELDREGARLRAGNAGLGSRVQELLGQIDGLVAERDEWRRRAQQEDQLRVERQASLQEGLERREGELEAMGAELRRLQRLLDRLPCAVLEVDGEGHCTGCNEQVAGLFGEQPPVGAPLLDWLQEFAPSESWARLVRRRWDEELLGEAGEAVFSLSDQHGLVREIELRRHPHPGRTDGCLLVGCDISELQAMRRRMDQLLGRYRVIYELGALGLAVVSTERGLVEVNPMLARVLGRSRRELLGSRLQDWFAPESARRVELALARCHELPEAAALELALRVPGSGTGDEWVKLSIVTVAREEERPLLQFCLIEDIHTQTVSAGGDPAPAPPPAVAVAAAPEVPWRVVGRDQVPLLAGLMQMESRQVRDDEARELLLAHSRRLDVLGLLQDLAPCPGEASDLSRALTELVRLACPPENGELPVEVDLQPGVRLDFGQVQRLLLAVHELLVHLLERGEDAAAGPRLVLVLAAVEGTVCLDLIDPRGMFDQRHEPLGLGLALCLVGEAGGQLKILPGPERRGTRVRILLSNRAH